MHSATFLAAAIWLAGSALADFQIYSVQDAYPDDFGGGLGVNSGWLFLPGEPDCDDINHSYMVAGTDDASHSGVRVQVADANTSPKDADVQLLEWNTSMGHFTIYGMYCSWLLYLHMIIITEHELT